MSFGMTALEESYKISRDLKAIVDTAFNNGKLEGFNEAKKEGKLELVKILKLSGVPLDIITKTTGISKTEIDKL